MTFAPAGLRRLSILCLFIAFCALTPSSLEAQAVSPLRIAPSAAQQISVIESLKRDRTPNQKKIDSRLYLSLLRSRGETRLAALPDFRFLPSNSLLDVEVLLSNPHASKAVVEVIETAGGTVTARDPKQKQINAKVPLSAVETIAAAQFVRKVRQALPWATSRINISEGDLVHAMESARNYYGARGAGMKVCVMSDGIDSLGALQASGDLPAVDVLPGQSGSGDEGSAMLEIVHDLAPEAELGFATALPNQGAFAQNILDLAASGCDVIVDDIIYLAESPFQDGPVAQAVNTVTASGVLYFSSAGNEGNKADNTSGTWEGDFVPNGTPAPLAGAGPVHNFGNGGQSILVESGNTQTPVLLIWAEHYDADIGLASTDYDLYVLNGAMTTIFDASTDTQDGVGDDDYPIEFVGGGAFAGERLVVARFVDGATSSDPMFNLILFRGELEDSLATSGATRGHSAAADAFSVAATPAALSFDGTTPNGPFPGPFTSANASESFSSDGPRRIILSPTGAELTPGNRTSTGGVVRQKPDFTAADGVKTAAPGFNPFYGTSAAAPHAAAIAAVLMSAVPQTPAEVRTNLINSAIDIEVPGVDATTGAGIIMADTALASAGATPQAYLGAQTPVWTAVFGDADLFIESNEVWTVDVPLMNEGGAEATDVSAVLSTTTPGVTILSDTSDYADLAPGQTGSNVTPYRIRVEPSAVCGGVIEFTLTITLTGGSSPIVAEFTARIGEPGTPVTITYAGPVVPIPDGTSLTGTAPGALAAAALAVSGIGGNVYDVNLQIDGSACSAAIGSTTVGIDHTFVNDLEISLEDPSGGTVLVINNTDGSGNNFCQTLLDDESAGPSIQGVASPQAPFGGSFTPNAPLSGLDGVAADGTWRLRAQDFFTGDIGNIRAFSLTITPAICDAPPLTAIIAASKTVSGTFRAGSTVTYTVSLMNTGGLDQANNPGSEFVDILPSSVTLVSAIATSGSAVATPATNTVTWDGAIASQGNVVITIVATVNDVPPATSVSNQGSAAVDGNGDGTNESTVLTDDPGLPGAADPTSFLTVGAEVSGTMSVSGVGGPGSTVTYEIVLTNSGNLDAMDNAGAELTSVLPAGLTLVTANATSGTALATIASNTVTWNGTIPAAGSVTLTVTATIDAGTIGNTLSTQASVSFDADGDGTSESSVVTDDPSSPEAGDATQFVVQGSIVTATKTVSGSFEANTPVTYTITLRNDGPTDAPDNAGDELVDVLPAGLVLDAALASSGSVTATAGTNTVTWNGTIPAGGTVTITIQATINPGTAGTTISNQGTVSFDADVNGTNESSVLTDDPAVAGDADATVFTVGAPSLAVTKSVTGAYRVGETVTYTIVVANTGVADAADNAGNELTDVLPSALTLVSANATTGTAVADIAANTVTWNGAVAAGADVTITIQATIDDGTLGQQVSNQAVVSYDADADGTNETDKLSDDPSVGGAADPTQFSVIGTAIRASKTVAGAFAVDGEVTYTITIFNEGPTAAADNPGNEFVDVLPAELTLVSASATAGAATADVATNTVAWNGSVAAHGSVTVTIVATVNPGTAGSVISNQGTVSFDGDLDGTNESQTTTDDPSADGVADATAFVVGSPVIAATKSVSGSFIPGATVTYTLVLTNSGAVASADNAGDELTDVLPSSLALVSATADAGTVLATTATNTVTWNGSVPAGGSVTITIEATILPAAAGQTVSNQATVLYDADLDGSNEASVATDDPATTAAGDATAFSVAAAAVAAVPTASEWGLMLLALGLAGIAVFKRLG